MATTLNNLALLLADTNRHAEAEPLLRRALEIIEKSLRPKDSSLAFYLNRLAVLLGETERKIEAELLFRRALTIDKKTSDQITQNVAATLKNLGYFLRGVVRHSGAEPVAAGARIWF